MKPSSFDTLGAFPSTRMRRMRMRPFLREIARETRLTVSDLIQPLFVHEGKETQPIGVDNLQRFSLEALVNEAQEINALGIPAIALFPAIESNKKSTTAEEAWNAEGLIPRAIKILNKHVPDIGVITDIALDPYTSSGHDGIIDADGQVLNDETINALSRQALCHARAGAQIIAPSDMMDGRVKVIREALEAHGFQDMAIISYAAKYASSYYQPFRKAVSSATEFGDKDKSSYQLDIANSKEALRECALDIQEGADALIIKPAMPCLDIIWQAKNTFAAPIIAYQVSGEYAMHCAAFANDQLPRDALILESLSAIKRAGANATISYFAKEAAQLLNAR